MDSVWYYGAEGQSRGPVTLEQLVAALLTAPEPRRVLVWRGEMVEWKEAGLVPEISARLPPPRPPSLPDRALNLALVGDAETTAKLYRRLVLLVGLQLLVSMAQVPLQLGSSQAVLLPVILVVLLGVLVGLSVTAYNLSRHLGESVPVLWAIAMFLPCINILGLLVLSSKAQSWCRQYGLKVGLLGPTKESIEDLRRRLMSSSFE